MPDVMVTATLYDSATPPNQIAGPAMIKTTPDTSLSKVTAAFCRWLDVQEEAVEFVFNGAPLATAATTQQAGVVTGNAISVRLRPGEDPPRAQGFTMLDVTDSELSSLADVMSVA